MHFEYVMFNLLGCLAEMIHEQKLGSEFNFVVLLMSAELKIVLNWNLTLFSLPRLVEASLEGKPSNEGSFAQTVGREKAGDESGGKKPNHIIKTL